MEEKRRIGIFLDTWDFGGIASFCLHLANGLQDCGYDVVLVLARRCKPKDASAAAAFKELLAVKKFRVLDLQLPKVPRREQQAFLLREMKKLKLDVLILNNFTNFLPAFNALSAETRLISVGHGDHSHSYGQFIAAQYFVHRHVAISQAIFETCASLCPPTRQYKLALCHHGAPVPTPHELSVPRGPLRVVYCGRFDFTDKRLQDIPPIWKIFLKQGGSGRLTLIGNGEVRRWLEKQFETEMKDGTVRFVGLLHGQALQNALAEEEIVLSISNWEGLGMAVIEAVLSGCYPILSDTRSGHREIVRELGGGVLYPIGDIEAFAEVLLWAVANRSGLVAERERLRQTATEKFSLERMVQGYDALIKAIMEEPLGTPADHLGSPAPIPSGFWRNLFHSFPKPIDL